MFRVWTLPFVFFFLGGGGGSCNLNEMRLAKKTGGGGGKIYLGNTQKDGALFVKVVLKAMMVIMKPVTICVSSALNTSSPSSSATSSSSTPAWTYSMSNTHLIFRSRIQYVYKTRERKKATTLIFVFKLFLFGSVVDLAIPKETWKLDHKEAEITSGSTALSLTKEERKATSLPTWWPWWWRWQCWWRKWWWSSSGWH